MDALPRPLPLIGTGACGGRTKIVKITSVCNMFQPSLNGHFSSFHFDGNQVESGRFQVSTVILAGHVFSMKLTNDMAPFNA